jgi:hypothetical protein
MNPIFHDKYFNQKHFEYQTKLRIDHPYLFFILIYKYNIYIYIKSNIY